MTGVVVAVHSSPVHRFSKDTVADVELVEGWGVAGDSHAGTTMQHRSRVAQDPSLPNVRQVHLLHAELFEDLRTAGFDVAPGQLGENLTVRGVDLLGLPVGTRLSLGADAVVTVTGVPAADPRVTGISGRRRPSSRPRTGRGGDVAG